VNYSVTFTQRPGYFSWSTTVTMVCCEGHFRYLTESLPCTVFWLSSLHHLLWTYTHYTTEKRKHRCCTYKWRKKYKAQLSTTRLQFTLLLSTKKCPLTRGFHYSQHIIHLSLQVKVKFHFSTHRKCLSLFHLHPKCIIRYLLSKLTKIFTN